MEAEDGAPQHVMCSTFMLRHVCQSPSQPTIKWSKKEPPAQPLQVSSNPKPCHCFREPSHRTVA